MKPETRRKVLCVVGGFAAMCVSGQYYLLGNLSTYIESYMVIRGDYSTDSTWFVPTMIACYFVGSLLGMSAGGYLDRAINSHWTGCLGLLFTIVGTILTHWTITLSTVGVVISLGVLPGIGSGLTYGCPFSALNKHDFKNLALFYGIVNAGFGGGAFVLNYVITGFVNPDNLSPDLTGDHGKYFSQVFILDRTPFVFLVLAACYLLLLPIAFIGMRPHVPTVGDSEKLIPMETSSVSSYDFSTDNSVAQTDCNGDMESTGKQHVDAPTDKPSKRALDGISPMQLFRYRTFYIVWITTFLNGILNNCTVGFYKKLGQTVESNDLFLTTVGTIGSLASAIGRPLWGFIIDRTSYKTASVVQAGLTTVFFAFWKLSLLSSSWLYFVWTVLMFGLASAMPILIITSSKCYFGPSHYVANLAVLWSSLALDSSVLPFVTTLSLTYLGWDGFLILLSALGVVYMLLALLLQSEMELVNIVSERNKKERHP